MAEYEAESGFQVELGVPIPQDEESPPIGINRPLYLRIGEVYSGKRHGDALLLSAIKSGIDNSPAAYAMHGLWQGIKPDEPQNLTFQAPSAGSSVMYYTAACLEPSLNLHVRISYDRFDEERYSRWIDLISQTALLPIFTAAGGIFGPAGPLGGAAVVSAGKKIAKVITGVLDRRIDGNDDDDLIANYTLNLDLPGLQRDQAGWILMRDDDDPMFINAAEDAGDKYVVDGRGRLRYRSSGRSVTEDWSEPFVLLHVSGYEDERLNGFEPLAATAELLAKFTESQGDLVGDLTELVSALNDVTMAKKATDLSSQIDSSAEGPAREKLQKRRAAVIKHIQDDEIREMVEGV